MKYLKNKENIIFIFTLISVCILSFFVNISDYFFVDNNETKFVLIAKEMLNNSDWINIKLFGENIFEFSPLYFWIVNIFCVIFGKISSESLRLPVSFATLACVLGLYFGIKPILSKIHAFIISLMFATSLGILIYSRLSTNDVLFVTFSTASILFAYSALLSKNNKTKFLFCVYLFSAFASLTAGLFGLIPFLAVFLMYIFSGEIKELFKPKNLLPGLIVFCVIFFPWHIIMVYKYGFVYIKEFLKSYNFIAYTGIKEILSVPVLFILGFSPWIFSLLWVLGYKIKEIYYSVIFYFKYNSQKKLQEKWYKLKRSDKFIFLNTILFFTYFVFAFIWGMKYNFLILFLMFPAACISGHYWYEYIIKVKHRKSIFFATIIPNLIMITFSIIGLFGHNMLNNMLFNGLSHLLIPLIIIFFAIPIIGIFSVIIEGKKMPFASNIILMVSLSFVLTPGIFNFISLNSGENDLISFSLIAQKNNAQIAAYIKEKKYCLDYYYDRPVQYIEKKEINELKKYLAANPDNYVVIEIKDMFGIEENKTDYELLESGKKYCLIKYLKKENENA